MFTSPRSEDWVTWNVFRLLGRRSPETWWPRVMESANDQVPVPLALPVPSTLDLWVAMNSPIAYEVANRARMAASDDPRWVAWAAHPKPVEGTSEIDVVIRGPGYLLLAEAKLTSDASTRTTYDPARDQIVRNIDCAIEFSGSELPLFWMFVKDRSPDRLFAQWINAWRGDPGLLQSTLPHRDPIAISGVIDRCAMITWAELLSAIEPSDPDEIEVLAELQKRIH